ncbi:hypothetical protein PG999_004412 [Apiospora kogelbergensis]|uniref:Uncharacterized protein n=1 Tax=Apiospora kogelbergensis TaxID=1337665 RepID=A0AAW0QZ89_9PEZI
MAPNAGPRCTVQYTARQRQYLHLPVSLYNSSALHCTLCVQTPARIETYSQASDRDTKAQHDTKPTHATGADVTRRRTRPQLILSQRRSEQRLYSTGHGSSIPRNLTAMSA